MVERGTAIAQVEKDPRQAMLPIPFYSRISAIYIWSESSSKLTQLSTDIIRSYLYVSSRTGRGIKQASLAVFVLCPFRCNIIKRKLEMKLVLLIGRLMIYIAVNAGIVYRLRFSFS